MKFPDVITIGDKYGPAMKIQDEAEAKAYLEACIEHNMRVGGTTRERATGIELQNLGYFAGYYSHETMERVNRLFKTQHPIFGKVAPTPEAALAAGKAMARKQQ